MAKTLCSSSVHEHHGLVLVPFHKSHFILIASPRFLHFVSSLYHFHENKKEPQKNPNQCKY